MEIPREYNAATWFVDRHLAEGRAARLAVIHEGGSLTYGDVAAGANRLGNALRRLAVRLRHAWDAQGGRTPASRHAGVLRDVRPARARDRARRPDVLGRQAVLRLRPGERVVLPVPRRRGDGTVSRPSRARQGVRRDRARASHAVLRRAHGIRRNAAAASLGAD